MAKIIGERAKPGDVIVDYEDKIFPDYQAEPGQKAFVFYHCVPFESSASMVNLLTATRILRKGFDTHFVMFGPGSLVAAATRGYPKVGDEAFPGNLNYNTWLRRFMDEGGHAYACRFSAAALYGMREADMMEGVQPVDPRDILDAAIMAWKERALTMNTWTM
ncbi:MAG TPA: MSMEG_0572/Sll0783 family nitrogen starvation response protein [Mycobacterium sp.]|nr:MSMEG_0572/Sll0783 family nitrogen starvation response protein [Mycobacterium sp.]